MDVHRRVDERLFEGQLLLVHARGNGVTQGQSHPQDQPRRDEVGPEQPLEWHAAGQHGDDLAVLGQTARHPNDGQEDDESAKQRPKMDAHVDVVQHRFPQRRAVFPKVAEVFHQVEHHHNHAKHAEHEAKRA